MVVGFNHNFRYKGGLYHVQTEDGGVKSPNIITLLYKGGTILASKKTSYSDIIKVDNLEQVVEELMKEQHREMLRRLKDGEFDSRLGLAATPAASAPSAAPPAKPVVPAAAPPVPPPPAAAPPAAKPAAPPPAPPAATPPSKSDKGSAPVEASLDEIILSYMVGDDRK